MKLKYKLVLTLLFLIFINSKLYALENKILFKVNNQIITTYDILDEAKYLDLVNDEFKNFEDIKIYEIAKKSIIRQLIKEHELKKFYKKIKLKDEFINKFIINHFEKYNLNSIDEVEILLNKNNLELKNLEKKLTIQLMWNELIFNKFSENVKIDKDLIEKEISKKETQEEFLLSEIVFNVNNKDELNKKFTVIKEELANNKFSEVAITHSNSETSINGGRIGWIKDSSLSNQIKSELKKINIGEITNPIKIPGAFIVLKIEDKRESILELNINKEVEIIVKRKTNEQLNQFSNIYFNKIKKNMKINEL